MLSILNEIGEHWYVHPNGRIYAKDPYGPDWEITPMMQHMYHRNKGQLGNLSKLLIGGISGSIVGTSLGIGGSYLAGYEDPTGPLPLAIGSLGGSLVGGLLSSKYLGNKMLNHIAQNPEIYRKF